MNEKWIKVTPIRPELKVLDENGIAIPAIGKVVRKSIFWLRLRNEGDILIEELSEKPKKIRNFEKSEKSGKKE